MSVRTRSTSAEVAGVDFSTARPDPAGLVAAGFQFVIGYVKPLTATGPNRMELSSADLAAYTGAGLPVAVVWETSTDRALSGSAGGAFDGAAARDRCTRIGYPAGAVVFCAVDFAATPTQLPDVLAYAEAFAGTVGHPAGIYGSAAVVDYAANVSPGLFRWQTAAWSGGVLSPAAHLYQRVSKQWADVAGTDEDVACGDGLASVPFYTGGQAAGALVVPAALVEPLAPAQPVSAPTPAPAPFDVAGWRLHYGDTDPHLPALRRWANRVYPAYASTPMDAGPTTNYGPQLRAFLVEFGRRIGVPNDGMDLGPRLAAGLWRAGFRG